MDNSHMNTITTKFSFMGKNVLPFANQVTCRELTENLVVLKNTIDQNYYSLKLA